MKVTLFLSSLWLFIASLFAPAEKAVLTGTVTGDKEALIGATVLAKKDRQTIQGVRTDINGKYRFELDPGTYDIEFSYLGFRTHQITEVPVIIGKENILDNTLEASLHMEEVVITGYDRRMKETRHGALGAAPVPGSPSARVTDTRLKFAKLRGTPDLIIKTAEKSDEPELAKSVPAMYPAPPAPARANLIKGSQNLFGIKTEPAAAPDASPADGGEVKTKGSRSEPTDIYIDGTSGEIKPVIEPEPAKKEDFGNMFRCFTDMKGFSEDEIIVSDKEASVTTSPGSPAPRAGLLTAGEWNDLQNWNRHWVDILADGETDPYQKMYGFYPRQRYTIMLTNENDFPIADALVTLKGDGNNLWEARTDNTGKAELWAALYTTEKETATLSAEILVDGRKHEITALKSAAAGFNYLKINAECNAPKNVDIVWAVDATGSMGDEIEYLKTELLDVIGRAKSRNPTLAYRMGTVFYRDKGDEYITKSSGLSPDIPKTMEFIQKQFAGGGGDFPEAVHSALEEAVFGQKWSENAVARICFLVLDASPHQEPEVIASLQKSIREAARLGIRIVPVTASGIQKDTEFLMKFFGLATNGSYVFLTDHSGIGGKHLEPTTDEYKVEPLNNLLVRLITEYTTVQTCEGKSEIRFENDPQQQPGPHIQALYYPNPTSDQFTLELPYAVQSVTIYDSEGKAVRKVEKPLAGANVILVNDLAAGFYTIRILNNGLMQSGKLLVVRS